MLILQAQEEERRRVAWELHDESSQNLTALLVHTEILQQALQRYPRPPWYRGSRAIARRSPAVDATDTTQAGEYSRAGAPIASRVLDDLGLLAALRWLAEDCRERLRI